MKLVLDLSTLKQPKVPPSNSHWYVEFLENEAVVESGDEGVAPNETHTWVAMVTNANNKQECYISPRNRVMSFSEVKVWMGQVILDEKFRESIRQKSKRSE